MEELEGRSSPDESLRLENVAALPNFEAAFLAFATHRQKKICSVTIEGRSYMRVR